MFCMHGKHQFVIFQHPDAIITGTPETSIKPSHVEEWHGHSTMRNLCPLFIATLPYSTVKISNINKSVTGTANCVQKFICRKRELFPLLTIKVINRSRSAHCIHIRFGKTR